MSRGVGDMDAVAELAFEAVAVEQGHESWKSASLPLCGVAVSSRKWRVSVESSWPSR